MNDVNRAGTTVEGLSLANFSETAVSQAIMDSYYDKFHRALRSDIVIAGAGPSGLVAAWRLAERGYLVVLLEKRLSPGGRIWGGSMGMNDIVVEEEAFAILAEAGVRQCHRGNLFAANATELACALCLKALHAGAILLTLVTAEDICVHEGRATGVVANRSILADHLPIDPIVLRSRATIDATGHEAFLVRRLHRRGLIESPEGAIPGEGTMDAVNGERFVVDHIAEVFPGLWVTGMSVCALLGGPRTGPIFGGMLLSGVKVAEQVSQALKDTNREDGYG